MHQQHSLQQQQQQFQSNMSATCGNRNGKYYISATAYMRLKDTASRKKENHIGMDLTRVAISHSHQPAEQAGSELEKGD
jgi:hypothetical protein